MKSFKPNHLVVDVWPRIQKTSGIPVPDLAYAVLVLSDNRIYPTFMDYMHLVNDEVSAEMLKLADSHITLYHADAEHLWVFVGLLYQVCLAFYMPFTGDDEIAMYPYRVHIPTGPGKADEIVEQKSKYESRARRYSASHTVIHATERTLWRELEASGDEQWLQTVKPPLLKRWAISSILLEVLTVISEIYRVQLQAFLEHPDVKQ